MTPKSKPKLRMAPSLNALTEQQAAAARLLALDEWTEVPSNPPPTGLAATIAPVVAELPAPERVVKEKPPAPMPLKPWEEPSADATHAYHLIMPERLFQKIDYVWKRNGYKSMKEWLLQTMEAEANKQLKQMGEGGAK